MQSGVWYEQMSLSCFSSLPIAFLKLEMGVMVRRSNHVRKGHNAIALALMSKRSGHPAWFECLTMTPLFCYSSIGISKNFNF